MTEINNRRDSVEKIVGGNRPPGILMTEINKGQTTFSLTTVIPANAGIQSNNFPCYEGSRFHWIPGQARNDDCGASARVTGDRF